MTSREWSTVTRAHADTALRAMAADAAIAALDGAGVRWAALKGYDLAHRVYPSLLEREMTDVDVLVQSLDGAARALIEAGFREVASEATHHRCFRSREGVMVELHHDLFDAPHRIRVDPSALLDRAVTLKNGLRVLAALDAWVHVAGHFAWSNAGGGDVHRAVRDLTLLGNGLDAEALWAQATAWRLERPIARAFAAARDAGVVLEAPALLLFASRCGLRDVLARRVLAARSRATMEGRPGKAPASLVRALLLAPSLDLAAAIVWTGFRRRRAS